MTKLRREGKQMVEKKNKVAERFVAILNNVLRIEANTTSCYLVYQPKAPKELKRFKNTK